VRLEPLGQPFFLVHRHILSSRFVMTMTSELRPM